MHFTLNRAVSSHHQMCALGADGDPAGLRTQSGVFCQKKMHCLTQADERWQPLASLGETHKYVLAVLIHNVVLVASTVETSCCVIRWQQQDEELRPFTPPPHNADGSLSPPLLLHICSACTLSVFYRISDSQMWRLVT